MYDSVKNKLSLVSDKDDESMISESTLTYGVFFLCVHMFLLRPYLSYIFRPLGLLFSLFLLVVSSGCPFIGV